ncbi:transcription repressor NadR [Garciella nitratireducens]|uniref:Transcriptional regulator n=1 Tax=Garciella nitratireducens DSM 15102 TaxID=1121911 RepID=A0A1T4NLM1_9FIRM|nr:transcription repressor NadR [Garciella nitratireducens]RBP38002.1 hypothetical protein DFR81_12128 [Garciella nitratireducens]SJZ80102.1 hypothetical protein SAMN02745973_01736 [Garciella nitratireducens DSM 15102]
MDSSQRRQKILEIIKERSVPIKGIDLAKKFHVSRQIIVQDIAILRAAGEKIIATPQGYVFPFSSKPFCLKKTIACYHKSDEIFDELRILVDMGAKVIDVMVDHPVYGEIKANLMISSRKELNDFVMEFKRLQAEPLSSLTEGIHLHTIEVPDESIYKEILLKLAQKGYLIEE